MSTVQSVLEGPPDSILGLLEAACDQAAAEPLCDALHPMLRTWVHEGGEAPAWQGVVQRLRGEHTNFAIGELRQYHFDAAVALVAESTPEAGAQWVRNVELSARADALWHYSKAWGEQAPEALLQLGADVLDSKVQGLSASLGAKALGRNLDESAYGAVIMRRDQTVIDVSAAGMLMQGKPLERASSLLEAVRDGVVQLTGGASAVLGGEREYERTWVLLVASGVRTHLSWPSGWGWRELCLAMKWAREETIVEQLARQALRNHGRVLNRRVRAASSEEQALLTHAVARFSDARRHHTVREALWRMTKTELVCCWAEISLGDGGLLDTELESWVKDCEDRHTLDNPLTAIGHARSSRRVAEALVEGVHGLSEAVLWSSSEEVGYVVGSVLARRVVSQQAWSLVLSMCRGFQGTLDELVQAANMLSGDHR
jgi:hypothetical protein